MTRRILTAPGTVTLSDLTIGSPPENQGAVVGTSNIWHDDDDATYAEVVTFEHPDVSYSMGASGSLGQVAAIGQNAARTTATARIRYQSLAADMKPPMVNVTRPAASSDRRTIYSAVPTGPGSVSPTWIDIPLSQADETLVADFLTAIKNGTSEIQLTVGAPWLSTYSFRYPRTRIFEAYLVVTGPGGDAPPCRIFPRSDGLGVGAGRAFPPPRSQQRSPGNRGVGYY